MTATWIDSPAALSRGRLRVPPVDTASGRSTSASVRDVRGIDYRPIDEAPAEWLSAVAAKLNELLRSSDMAMYPRALQGLVRFLADPVLAGTPMPFISPVGDSGISAEFRSADVELHVEFDRDGDASVYAYQRSGVEWEGPLSGLPDGIEKWAWRLAHGTR